MENRNLKGWLYLLPAMLFLGVFMVYPLVDVVVYSFEEGYNSASQTYFGIGLYNYNYVLHDPYFLQALKNTFILVIITVPVSTGLALLISSCDFFVDNAVLIAKSFGVNDAFISLTLIACGTSLPELAASLAAAVKKNTQLALGNIVGSNIFNILCIFCTGITFSHGTFYHFQLRLILLCFFLFHLCILMVFFFIGMFYNVFEMQVICMLLYLSLVSFNHKNTSKKINKTKKQEV